MMLDTVKHALVWGEEQLASADIYLGHGFDNPWDEALALLLYVLKLGWDSDTSLLERPLSEKESQAFQMLITERIETHKPVAYLVQEAWFMGLPFHVNEDVLIPRSPIAELIASHFELWFSEAPQKVLDLCTGSACIAIAIAMELQECQVDASDISEKALSLAARNIERFGVGDRVHLYRSDLFSKLPEQGYQLIVSNPPYVDEMDMLALPAEYRHEPRMALAAGEDGLDFVRQILFQAGDFLVDNGVLIVEVGNSQEAVMDAFPDINFLWLEFEHGGHGVFALRKEELPHTSI